MHFFAVVAAEARVGISLRAKFFPTRPVEIPMQTGSRPRQCWTILTADYAGLLRGNQLVTNPAPANYVGEG